MNLAIFDVDGTLLDNLRCEDECYAQALRVQLGIPALRTDWERYEHISDQGIAIQAFTESFGAAPSTDALSATIDYFIELLGVAHGNDPIASTAGAAELLYELPSRGWAVGIATGAWRRAAEFKLSAAGLSVAALPMATAEDGPARVAIVSAALRRAEYAHGVSFGRVVAVGDGVWDVAAARSLGLPFVGVSAGERAARLRAAGASTVVADFSNLDDTVAALESAAIVSRPSAAPEALEFLERGWPPFWTRSES